MTVDSSLLDSTGPAGRPLRIDVVVHGRFHAFHLARALLARGHDVRLLTNYPSWAVQRFAFPRDRVKSFVTHGVATRIQNRLLGIRGVSLGEPTLHRLFGWWAARTIRPDADVVYIFSGIAEEALIRLRNKDTMQLWLVRGSSHIQTQHKLLDDEEKRVQTPIDKPSDWSLAREQREYELARRIVTLSKFSHASFQERPALAAKSMLLMSAVDATRFRPDPSVIAERCRRIQQAGSKLRVLNVGALSYRKGAQDFVELAQALSDRMEFRFVGDLPVESRALQQRAAAHVDLHRRIPEFELVQHYAWADVFVFPTVEDGFPAVVAQAQASGLVVLTTPNGSGPDLIDDTTTGWILPIRDSAAFMAKLEWCDRNRAQLADMTMLAYRSYEPRDWSMMAKDFERNYAAVTRQ